MCQKPRQIFVPTQSNNGWCLIEKKKFQYILQCNVTLASGSPNNRKLTLLMVLLLTASLGLPLVSRKARVTTCPLSVLTQTYGSIIDTIFNGLSRSI